MIPPGSTSIPKRRRTVRKGANMAKTETDVLEEWKRRGYIPEDSSEEDREKYLSYILQAKDSILSYCNLPLNIKNFPDGLFYPWVDISYSSYTGTAAGNSGTVKSVTEGDTTISFSDGSASAGSIKGTADISAILNRYRRLP